MRVTRQTPRHPPLPLQTHQQQQQRPSTWSLFSTNCFRPNLHQHLPPTRSRVPSARRCCSMMKSPNRMATCGVTCAVPPSPTSPSASLPAACRMLPFTWTVSGRHWILCMSLVQTAKIPPPCDVTATSP